MAEQKTVHQVEFEKHLAEYPRTAWLKSVDDVREQYLSLAARAETERDRVNGSRQTLYSHKYAAYLRVMAVDRLALPAERTGKGWTKRRNKKTPIQSIPSRSPSPEAHEAYLHASIGAS